MLDPSNSRLESSLAMVLILAAVVACRAVPPALGTPLGAGEGLAVGVVREHNGWGLRQADLFATSEQVAADVARLIGISDRRRSVVLLLDDPSNASALPAGSFAPIRFQLVSGIARACEATGFRVVRASDPGGAQAEYSLLSEIHGLAREDGFFVVDYVVVEGSRRAERAGGLMGSVRAKR